ncbi:MAG: response regulator, partial [Chloroflexi bacterium]
DGFLEGGRACDVQPPGRGDHGHAVAGLTGFDGKCHSRKSIWQKVGTLASLHCMAVARSAAAERILVVDDDEPLARVMARVLRSRGFECDVALTASEARRLLAANEYAVALLDVRLPDDSGYGLLEELRSTRPDTAVVMISGVDDPELGKAALEHGAFAYHVKPVGATQLYLLVVNNLPPSSRRGCCLPHLSKRTDSRSLPTSPRRARSAVISMTGIAPPTGASH